VLSRGPGRDGRHHDNDNEHENKNDNDYDNDYENEYENDRGSWTLARRADLSAQQC
jgi:hypothetical protein